jgi:Helix-turn-helix domain
VSKTALEPLLTTEQVADILNVAPHTLAVWRTEERRDLPWVKFGRFVRYQPDDVRRYLEARVVGFRR